VIDMSGFNAITCIAALGALTATQTTSLKIQAGNAANLSDAVDLPLTDGTTCQTANAADADSNKLLVAEAILPSRLPLRPARGGPGHGQRRG
jgi:hypothetical protein